MEKELNSALDSIRFLEEYLDIHMQYTPFGDKYTKNEPNIFTNIQDSNPGGDGCPGGYADAPGVSKGHSTETKIPDGYVSRKEYQKLYNKWWYLSRKLKKLTK